MVKENVESGSQAGPSRTGPVRLEVGAGFLANGKPDLSPAAGYVAATPYQYSDENDTLFAARVASWESAKASALDIASGGPTIESRRASLKAKFDADMAALDKEEAGK